MNHQETINRIYEHLESDHAEKAVMGCLRLARSVNDHLSVAIFMRELYPDKHEVGRALFDDTSHLTDEARKFIWETSLNRWLELHTLDISPIQGEDFEDDDEPRVLKIAIGEIEPELENWEGAIRDLTIPAGMDPFDIAAFTDRWVEQKARIRLQMKALQTLKHRVKTRCLNYATQMERQLRSQKQSQGFLEGVQNEVNNFFKAHSDDVFTKLMKAAELSAACDHEDASLLLTEVRRTMKAVADHLYPPVKGDILCSDGKARSLGDEQYLNRLQEFLATQLPQSTANDLLKVELEHIVTFFRRLNDMASKGVHASATLAEARQGLVGLYFFLYNLSQRLSSETGLEQRP